MKFENVFHYTGLKKKHEDFQMAVLMNWFQYKQKMRSISCKIPFNICSLFLKNYTS
jgi:hypothetical protein